MAMQRRFLRNERNLGRPAFLLLALVAFATAAETCSDESLRCAACDRDSASMGNTMHDLPRFVGGTSVSANIGTYNVIRCDTTSAADASPHKGERCPGGVDMDKTAEAFGDLTSDTSGFSSASNEPSTYAGGVIMYPVLAVVGALIAILFLPLFCFTRYCCCCAKGCSTCGKKFPSRYCCCCETCCTFQEPDPDDDNSKARYPKWQRALAFVWMTVFVASTIIVASLGIANGFAAVPDSIVAMSEAPRGMANAGRSTLRPISRFMVSFASDSLTGTLAGLRSAVIDTIDLRKLESDLRCTTTIVTDAIDTDELAALVNEIDAAVNKLPNTTTTRKELVSLNDTVSSLPRITGAMDGHIVALNTSINRITAIDIKTPLISLNSSVEAIRPFPSKTLATFASVDSFLPSADDISGPSSSLSSRLGDLADGTRGSQLNASGGLPFRNTLVTDLNGVATNFTKLPDLAAFASDLEAFNTTLDGLTADVNAIEPLVQELQSAIDAMPNFDAMVATTRDMQSLVEGLSLTGIKSAIVAMNTAIKSLPDLGRFSAQFAKIRGIPGQLGCVYSLVDAIETVNRTLVEFPGDSVDSVVSSVNDINSTLVDAVAQIDKLEGNINDFNNTLTSLPDLDKYIADIDKLDADVSTTKSSVNFTTLIDSIESVKSSTNISFASLLTSIRDLQTTLANPNTRPTTSMTTNLRSLNETTGSLPPVLRTAASSVTAFGNGICIGAPTEACVCAAEETCLTASTGATKRGPAKAGQCAGSGGQCNMIAAARVRVCRPTTGTETTLTTCTSNGDCTGSVCVLLDFSSVATELNSAATNVRNKPSTASLTGQLTSVQSNLDSLPSLDDKIGEVDSFTKSSNDLRSEQDLDSIRKDIKDVEASTNTIPDVGSFIKDWDSISDTLDSFDFGDVKKQLNDLNKTRDDIPTKTLNDLLDTVNKTVKFIYEDLDRHLTSMGRANLQRVIFGSPTATTASIDNVDLAAGLEVILSVFEDIFNVFDFSTSTLDTVRKDFISRVRVMQSGELLEQGALYYFVNLLDGPTVASDKGSSVFVDKQGKKYTPADRTDKNGSTVEFAKDLCITKSCIQKFADDSWTQPLATTLQEPPIEGSAPSGTDVASLSVIVILFYIPFFIFALVGICACTVGIKCPRCNPAICIVVVGCTWLPWMLILNGALLVPPVLFAADMCASVEDLGQQYVVADEASICESFGAAGDSYSFDPANGLCTIVIANATTSSPAIEFSLNAVDLYKDTFGGCGLTSGGKSPYAAMYSSMGSGLSAWPQELVDDEALDNGPVKMKPKLKDPIKNGTRALGPAITQFFADAGLDLGCPTVSNAVYGFKDAICCDMVGTVSWIAYSFWVCTWILFCCGPCAAMYGRKRFPNNLWGPEVEELEGGGETYTEGVPARPQPHYSPGTVVPAY